MSEAFAAGQLAELHGPDHNPFYGTYVRDWIALCDDLRDADVRGYLILRSLVFEGKGVTNRVRVLTLAELCKLIPGPNGKPSSLSRVRELLRRLSAVGLVTAPEGGPVTTSSGGKAQGKPLRVKIHDQPANDFTPTWPNTEEKLSAIRPEAENAAREAAERDATRAAAKAADTGTAGQNSDQRGLNSDQRGLNSDQRGLNSDPESSRDQGKRAPYSFPYSSSPSTTSGADAVGQGAGGYARAGARDGAAGETGDRGGSAASGKTSSPSKTRKARPATVKTRPRKTAPGYDDVRAAVPAAVARPGTALYPGLTRAINDLLTGNAGAGIPARTPGQVVARLNRRWYGEDAELRAAADYRGCDRCTASGCEAPRRSEEYPDGCDRIKNPSSWLAAALLMQDCPDPACDDGQLPHGRGNCVLCQKRAADRQSAREEAERLRERWERETAELAARRQEREARDGVPAGHYAHHDDQHQEEDVRFGVPRQAATWRCQGSGCGRVGRGDAPDVPLCSDCQEDIRLSLQDTAAPF